ncbi:MAG: hypothetical protein WC959_01905 [Kiritimatiellales bacterium]
MKSLIELLVIVLPFFSTAFGLFATTVSSVPSSWIYVGNEKEVVVDPETGREIIYLSSGEFVDTQFHYHGETWGVINHRTWLFFSSSRPRPDVAGGTVSGERQIMAADIMTGNLYYLTTVFNDGLSNISHFGTRPYYATYNDKLKVIVFFDKSRSQIFGYNCLTGVLKKMLTLPEGATSRELDDCFDGTTLRLIYPYTIPADGGMVGYISVSDFDCDLTHISTRIVKSCSADEALNHVEIRPDDINLFFYKHHSEKKADGQYSKGNVYIKNLENDDSSDIVVNSENELMDHMIWGHSGDYIYWDDQAGSLMRFDYKKQKIEKTGSTYTLHNYLSSDEKFWVYDLRGSEIDSTIRISNVKITNRPGSIWIYNMKTGHSEKYANITWGDPHPRHPHAVFSFDDNMISFVTGAEDGNSRVAIMWMKK